MNRSEARRVLGELQKEFNGAEALVDQGLKRMRALTKVIQGYHELYPDLRAEIEQQAERGAEPLSPEPSEAGEPPRGQDAVLRVLTDFPNKPFGVARVCEELHRRGWLPKSAHPDAAVRMALERLVNTDPEVHKIKRDNGSVRYGYVAANSSASEGAA
jgi:hypothetical protein